MAESSDFEKEQRSFRDILDMEELQKDTDITKSILESVKVLLAEPQDSEKKTQINKFLVCLNLAFAAMMHSVTRFKRQSTKREKLWILFHKFSVTEGSKLCEKYDKSMKLEAHEIFW